MPSTKKDELEITILTKEQIEALPQEAVDTVMVLNDDLANKQLKIFVPVVQNYMELRDLALSLKVDKDEDGKITKECIQSYKDLKKATGSFNSSLKNEIKRIKDPLNDTKSKVISVEKTFKTESDKIKDAAELLFKEYEDEVALKKQQAIDKKNAALNAKITEAENEAAELKKTSSRSETINNLKYKETLEGITQKASDAVTNLNEGQVKALSQTLGITDFKDVLAKYDTSDIDDATLDSLEVSYVQAVKNAKSLLDNHLLSLNNERELAVSRSAQHYPSSASTPDIMPNTRNEDVAPNVPETPMGIPGSTPEEIHLQIFMNTPSSFFVQNVQSVLNKIEEAIDTRLSKTVTEDLMKLKLKFNQFNS